MSQRLQRFFIAAAIWLTAQAAGAASTDRNTLYGLSEEGTLVKIDTSTGAGTIVRQLPFPIIQGSNEKYQNLAVYQGSFVTITFNGVIVFGSQPNDQVRIGLLSPPDVPLYDYTEYPGNGLLRGWRQSYSQPYPNQIREINIAARSESSISAQSDIYPLSTLGPPYQSCTMNAEASTFFGSNKSYFFHRCFRTDGYSGQVPVLVRVELQGGSWVKTLDRAVSASSPDGSLAADPATDGVLYVGAFDANGATALRRLVIVNDTTVTSTLLQTISGIGAIRGLAFGPPVVDVVAPGNVDPLKPITANRPWTPIQMLLQ